MKSLFLFFVLIYIPSICLYHLELTREKPVVKPEELREWVSFLASDKMRGRANGSPEMKTAASWIAGKFDEYGLKSVGADSELIRNYSFSHGQQIIEERNVIGMIGGSDPSLKDEYIVLSAHFDHIGVKQSVTTDSIYNGADDNAAGTCTLIGIAKAIRAMSLKPGRSIIFAAFSGEETGTKGSRNFVSNPPVPLKNIYVDLNFEMTGHSEYLGKKKYYMTGCEYSNLDDLINTFNIGTGFQLIDTISIANNLFFASDNISFSSIMSKDGISTGIPSGTFATTTFAPYIHNVTDEAELFDFENMADLVQYFCEMVIWISHNKSDIIWTDPHFTRLR